jgi:hypothetical protein
MARQPKTTEENKNPQGEQTPTPPVNTPSVSTAQAQEDPGIAAKMAELDEEIKKAREFNERMAQKEKKIDEMKGKVDSLVEISGKAAANVAVAHKTKAQRMKEHLAKQPKVKIFVPTEGKEKVGTVLPVTLNGYRLNIPKGRYVEVPEQVAQVVMDSLNQTQDATSPIKEDGKPLRLDEQNETDQQRVA